ncbi:hypothetical protein D6T64_08040 [Cryobacterium melibiosiphilum]|uniref:Uncharacterized protein n=1 Tax=Cryobacterium melibiosiphilum TaxID=995039 RepID=A0A3A5MJ38_9MICO|nr:hypothetical protein D6T64_08040 [Cryobacterium melibiosiphilum]
MWLPADTALWTTCHIVFDTVNGHVPQHRIDTLFPLTDGEVAVTAGNLFVDSFHAAGDGSYNRSSTFVWGTGAFGLALAAGTLAASAAGNASRRNQAAADAQEAWRSLFGGTLFVTTGGFYIHTRQGLFRWRWEAVDLMQVVAFNVVIMQARSTEGPVTWRLTSEWAELVFALWALHRHPNHPQLRDGTWPPTNWLPWATEQGYRPHLDRPQLAP